jgi:hypothetical protein
MKTMTILATVIFLFVMMISPLNAQEEEIAPPLRDGIDGINADGTDACTTGDTGWIRPMQEIWQSGGTTWMWVPAGKNFWAQSSNDVTEVAMINCVASAHYCQVRISSCSGGYGNVSVVRLWNY